MFNWVFFLLFSILLIFVIFSTGILVQILLGSTTYELILSSISSLLISVFLIRDAQVTTVNVYFEFKAVA